MAKLVLGGDGSRQITAESAMANRHGLVAGATGTGKTVTLQVLAEQFSAAGVPVILADIKGDLSGMGTAGEPHPKITERLRYIGLEQHAFTGFPVVDWDVLGRTGHPVRTTVSELGPLLLGNLLELNDTQTGVLYALFKAADDRGWLLLDLADLVAMLTWLGENARELQIEYGNISSASIGAIRRRLLVLQSQGLEQFLGEPALKLEDLIRTENGRGIINRLDVTGLVHTAPKLYATVLLWLLSELFEELPEVGDADRPKLALFFDEAHLLFDDAPKVLLDKIEQVVRLIRSKGVGVYFVTQSPLDIPESVLGQLGLKIQHALRAFTPKDKKAVRAIADNFVANSGFDTAAVVTELGVGEALVSTLDAEGRPTPVARTLMSPPLSRIGPASAAQLAAQRQRSPFGGKYDHRSDRESAHEILTRRAAQTLPEDRATKTRPTKTARRPSETAGEAFVKSMSRSIGSQVGRQIVRGILGSLFKGRR